MSGSLTQQAVGAEHRGTATCLSSAWRLVERATERLCNAMLYTAGFTLLVMMVVMTAYVISRKLGIPLPGSFYLSQELMVLLFCLPLGAVTLRNGHIIFELLDKLCPERVQAWLRLTGAAIGFVFFSVLSWKALTIGLAATQAGEYQQGVVNVWIWPFRLLLAASLVVFSLSIIVAGVRQFLGAPTASLEDATDIRLP